MNISISYLCFGENEPETIHFSPENYFDPLEPGENYWEHGIEVHQLAENYLPVEISKVKWFIITKRLNDKKRVSRYQLLNGTDSMSIHTIDEEDNEEIITASKIAPETWHTVRIIKPHNGCWSTYMDNIGSDIEVEGKFRNENLIKNWTYEEMKEFSHVQTKNL